ncbi:hypothetical protein CYMTET_18904 [Cymbomonas tetramitiformis]|uniref:Uncharacterized protein n=1 Tax=Cymbomonas tetramitiformis TaxID=36881 RepID=A0AAE0G769_9CHLO|nr:hypothetical protein CYMTET_18904 [Cymbomonas tetramitiformis]
MNSTYSKKSENATSRATAAAIAWRPSMSLHGRRTEIEAKHGSIRAVEYLPPSTAKVIGAIILTPGSGGGLGPGLSVHPQPFDDIKRASAQGGIYMRLGMELSSGREVDWRYRPTGDSIQPLHGGRKASSREESRNGARRLDSARAQAAGRADYLQRTQANSGRGRGLATESAAPKYTVAVLQIDWSVIPRKALRRKDMLVSSVNDVIAAAEYFYLRFPVPTILGGFSFGGPTVWAAARHLATNFPEYPIAGVLTMAGSARGGERFETSKLDTVGAVKSLAGTPVLLVQGTHDRNVAMQVSEYIYQEASAPKELVVAAMAPHMFDNCREVVYNAVRRWVLTVFSPGNDGALPAGRLLEEKITILGKEMQLKRGEEEGKENWRCQVAPKRLHKYCNAEDRHALAGLVGYSE